MLSFSQFIHFLQSATLAVFAIQAVTPVPAYAGSADEGQAIAERWCAGCHNVEHGDGKSASDGAPTFQSVARRKNFNRVQLETWIGNPHPPMPNLNLTRNEIDNLANYIESLRIPR